MVEWSQCLTKWVRGFDSLHLCNFNCRLAQLRHRFFSHSHSFWKYVNILSKNVVRHGVVLEDENVSQVAETAHCISGLVQFPAAYRDMKQYLRLERRTRCWVSFINSRSPALSSFSNFITCTSLLTRKWNLVIGQDALEITSRWCSREQSFNTITSQNSNNHLGRQLT